MASAILVDGQRGVVKNRMIEALRSRLVKSGLEVQSDITLELVDFLLGSKRLQDLKGSSGNKQVIIVDTKHILGLSHAYYGTKEIGDYGTVSRSLAIVRAALTPVAIIVVDSLAGSANRADTRRGYLWEAKQRHYHVVSRLADMQIVYGKLLDTLKLPDAPIRSAVPLKDVLRSRQNRLVSKSRSVGKHVKRRR